MRWPSGMRWWELLPEVVLVAGLSLFAVTEWSAARSAFTSTTALGLMIGAALLWLVGRVLLSHVPWPAIRFVVFGVAAVAILSVVVLPAYDDETVVEAFPAVAAPPSSSAPATTDEQDTPTTTSGEPIVLRSGSIRGIDHDAVGTASLYRAVDGSLVVGLEDIDIQPGPDYDLYVVPGIDREDIDGATRLDDLRGNKGTQYYEVPVGIDVSTGEWTVLVWCETFDVPVAGATPV